VHEYWTPLVTGKGRLLTLPVPSSRWTLGQGLLVLKEVRQRNGHSAMAGHTVSAVPIGLLLAVNPPLHAKADRKPRMQFQVPRPDARFLAILLKTGEDARPRRYYSRSSNDAGRARRWIVVIIQ
jgi:hypothetical protein